MSTDFNFENFRSMIDNIITGVCAFEYENDTFTPVYINEGFFRMMGYSRAQGMRYMNNFRKMLIPEDLPVLEQWVEDVLKDDGAIETEFRTVTGSGNLRWLQMRGNLYAREGTKYTIVAMVDDITERKNIEEELRIQAERLHILSQAEKEKIMDYNAKTDVMIIRVADEYGQMNDRIFNNYLQNFSGKEIFEDDIEYYRSVFTSLLRSPRHDTVEIRSRRFDEDYTWYQATLTSLLGTEGYVSRIVGRLINIHERKLKEIDMMLREDQDALTGLYNKDATISMIENALAEESVENGLDALMIIDLDNFQEVNDLLGHAEGDKVLADAAGAVSEIFKGGDIVGRIGGDEFIVYMRNIKSIFNTDILASKVLEKINFVLPCEEREDIHVTCSIGISIYPYHGINYEELFEKADKAVYTAKANGKNGYRIYNAAATMAYHASRKGAAYDPEKGMETNSSIEDLILQILYEDKVMSSALKSSVELLTQHYGFHRGRICDLREEAPLIQFSVAGYEMGQESEEHNELRKIVAETLFESYKNLSVLHDYDMSAEELELYLKSEGIKSMLYYPLTSNMVFMGAIILENHEDVQMEMSEEKTAEIRSILRILESYILQIGLMDRLHDFVTHIELFDNMDHYIYIVNVDTYEISFLNKKVLARTPDIKIGDICYKALQHRDMPCENCVFNNLDKNDPHAKCSEEVFNYSMRSWNRYSVSWLECKADNALGLINSIDISEYFMG